MTEEEKQLSLEEILSLSGKIENWARDLSIIKGSIEGINIEISGSYSGVGFLFKYYHKTQAEYKGIILGQYEVVDTEKGYTDLLKMHELGEEKARENERINKNEEIKRREEAINSALIYARKVIGKN